MNQELIKNVDFLRMITDDIKEKLNNEKSKQKTFKIMGAVGFFLFITGAGLFNSGYPNIVGLALLAGGVLLSTRQAVFVNIYTVYSELIDQIASETDIPIANLRFSLSDDADRKLEAIKRLVETNNLDGYEVKNDTRVVKTGIKRDDVFSPNFATSKKSVKTAVVDEDDPFHSFYVKKATKGKECPACGAKTKPYQKNCKNCGKDL